jgi:hypothetical protein
VALAGAVVLVVVVLLIIVLATTLGGARSAKAGDTGTETVDGPTVEYRVPDGQDPVAVISRLRQEGYDARPVEPAVHPTVVVICPPDGRDDLRRAIATAPMSSVEDPHGGALSPQQVRFTDE